MESRHTPRKKNSYGLVILIFLAFAIIISAIITVVKYPNDDSWENPDDTDINNPAFSGFLIDPAQALMLYPFGNGIIKVSRSRISYLDLSGKEIYGEVAAMEAPLCSISENKAIIADTNGVSYMTFDVNKNHFSSTSTNTIDFANINKDGYTILITDEPGLKGVAKIFNPAGEALFSWKSSESGYIIAGQISPDSKYVDLCILNTDGAYLQPVLRRFTIKGEATTQFIPEGEELYSILLYDESNDPVLVGQSKLIAFNKSGEKYSQSFNKIYTASSSEYGVLVVARKTINEIPSLYIIKEDGKISQGIPLSEETTSIAVKDDLAAVGSGNTVVTVSLKKMEEMSRNTISASTVRVGFSPTQNRVIVVARDGVTSFLIK